MSERPLREQIRREVQQHHLDDDQYAELERMMARKAPSGNQTAGLSRRRLLVGTATAAALAGLAVGGLPWLMDNRVGVEALADEVLKNHRNLKSLDLEVSGFEQLTDYFGGGLDFRLVRSQRVAWDNLVLEGGRYCSLAGVRAAQLVMHTPDDAVVSFYQTRYDPERFGALPHQRYGEAPVALKRENHWVQIWVERGIVMAIALPHAKSSLVTG